MILTCDLENLLSDQVRGAESTYSTGHTSSIALIDF